MKAGRELALVVFLPIGSAAGADEPDSLARDLPSGRSAWSLLETLEAPVVLDRIEGAGLYPAEPGRFSMRGASWTQNRVLLDGVDATDPLHGGSPLFIPDLDGVRAVETVSALAPAEYAGPGVTLALSTREPAASWRGTAQGYGLGSGLQSQTTSGPPPIARFRSLVDAGAVASGPIAGERWRLLASARYERALRLERAEPDELESRLASGLVELAYAPGEPDSLHLVGAAQQASRPLAARARFPGASVDESADAIGATAGWSRVRDRAQLTVSAGYWRVTSTPQTGGLAPDGTVERLMEGPVPSLVFASRSERSSASAGGKLAIRASALGGGISHAPRFGLALSTSQATESAGPSGSIPETVDGLAARVWDYVWPGPDSHRQLTDLGLWASDRLAWHERVVVDAGLRFQRTTGDARGAALGVSWASFLPRVSMRVLLADGGRLTLVGGWGEYGHQLLLDHLAFGDPNAPYAAVYRWNDANGDGRYEPGERGPLVARVGPGTGGGSLSAIDPGLRRPRTRELVAGLESSPGAGWRLSLTAFDRRETDLVESVDVGAPASAYDVRYLPDPGSDIAGPQDDQLLPVFERRPESFGLDRYVLTNPASHTGLHQAVELRVEGALGSRIRFHAGATASRTEVQGGNRGFGVDENDQGVVGELFDDPNADTYSRGRGFFDRAYTIKLGGAWHAPGDLRLGFVARYQDGEPFARLVVVPDLAQGPEAIQATTRGETFGRTNATDPVGRVLGANGHRFAYTLTVDVRLEKGFAMGAHRLALVAEAFNLLGLENEVEEEVVWGPSFREPTAVQPPRVVRIGARFDF